MKAKFRREYRLLKKRYPPKELKKQLVEIEAVEEARRKEVPREAGPEWYNYRYDRHSACKKEYEAHPLKSVYAPCWQVVLKWIESEERVADFGCGVGQFAQLLIDAGRKYVLGVDFSTLAIRKARKRNPAHAGCFVQADLYERATYRGVAFDVAVFLETMEHLARDLVVLKRIPVGKKVILSVPNFISYAHCRWFATMEDAVARYSPLLRIERTRRFTIREGNYLWLMRGVRYAD